MAAARAWLANARALRPAEKARFHSDMRVSSAVVVDDASTPVTSQDADKHVRAAWRGEGETIEFDHATNPERRG